MTRWVQGLAFGLLLSLFLIASGCADDLYGACTIESDNPILLECDASSSASCVVEEQLECSTRVCGKYRGSKPFCTVACSEDEDCPSGECREFVFQSGQKYCVADVDIS